MKGSNRPSDHYENGQTGKGYFQGKLSAEDTDTNGGADTDRTVRTPAIRRALWRTERKPRRGK